MELKASVNGLQCGSLEPSCCSVIKSCPTLCDSIDCSSSGLSVLHCLLEFSQTHVHCVSDAFQPSSPLLPPSPPALNLSYLASGSFPMSPLFTSSGRSIGVRFSISPSNKYSGLISFRMDWLDLLAVQEILKSLLQHHSFKFQIILNTVLCH